MVTLKRQLANLRQSIAEKQFSDKVYDFCYFKLDKIHSLTSFGLFSIELIHLERISNLKAILIGDNKSKRVFFHSRSSFSTAGIVSLFSCFSSGDVQAKAVPALTAANDTIKKVEEKQ
jgi:hypothetical protein